MVLTIHNLQFVIWRSGKLSSFAFRPSRGLPSKQQMALWLSSRSPARWAKHRRRTNLNFTLTFNGEGELTELFTFEEICVLQTSWTLFIDILQLFNMNFKSYCQQWMTFQRFSELHHFAQISFSTTLWHMESHRSVLSLRGWKASKWKISQRWQRASSQLYNKKPTYRWSWLANHRSLQRRPTKKSSRLMSSAF